MKIGLTFNLKEDLGCDNEFHEEFDSEETIEAISKVFKDLGHQVVRLGASIKTVDLIKKNKIDFVFNIAEGYNGRSRESQIPSLLEMLKIPYSGSDPVTLGLALDKVLAKKIMKAGGIPTPKYNVIDNLEEVKVSDLGLKYPLITKPAWEGSSKGIYNDSKVENFHELERSLIFLFDKYPNHPLVIEEYIKGKEITVGVIGNNNPSILGMMEIGLKNDFSYDFFYSLEIKRDWERLVGYKVPPDIEDSVKDKLSMYSLLTFREFGCRDIARVDFRISEENEIFVLEINPLPGLSPKYSDLVIMTSKLGISYKDLIENIFFCALSRYRLSCDKGAVREIPKYSS